MNETGSRCTDDLECYAVSDPIKDQYTCQVRGDNFENETWETPPVSL